MLNPHRSHDFLHNQNKLGVIGESINNRTFAIAACEAFQLIEEKPDLYTFFTKEEMTAYQDDKDCLQKVIMYINDAEQRQIVVRKAREVVMKQHTLQQRIQKMLDIIYKNDLGTNSSLSEK